MVFVTLGNAKQPFVRLLRAVEEMASKGFFSNARIVVQSGGTPFTSQFCEVRAFIPPMEFESLLASASLIITHGGLTALVAVRMGRHPVVVPRLRRYGEHVNDHQLQVARALRAMGRAQVAFEISELERCVVAARARMTTPIMPPKPTQTADLIASALHRLGEGRARWC